SGSGKLFILVEAVSCQPFMQWIAWFQSNDRELDTIQEVGQHLLCFIFRQFAHVRVVDAGRDDVRPPRVDNPSRGKTLELSAQWFSFRAVIAQRLIKSNKLSGEHRPMFLGG